MDPSPEKPTVEEDPEIKAVGSDTYRLSVGSVIPAVLVSGINSDLPGMAIAQMSKNVSDSKTGTVLLIPQGSGIIGVCDTNVKFRQSRVMVRWSQIILPSGELSS